MSIEVVHNDDAVLRGVEFSVELKSVALVTCEL